MHKHLYPALTLRPIFLNTHMHALVHTHTHTYTRTHMHALAHTNTHTHTRARARAEHARAHRGTVTRLSTFNHHSGGNHDTAGENRTPLSTPLPFLARCSLPEAGKKSGTVAPQSIPSGGGGGGNYSSPPLSRQAVVPLQ
jgi:hypothetical protein